jgi:hypothetical protein
METLVENKEKEISERYKDIAGWGIDADPENDPTYPMKNRTDADFQRLNYERAPQQPVHTEILRSNERPSITRVFGTSSPPSGLSGNLRRFAFKFSEGSAGHWLTLILADRINEIEGVVDDFKRGYFPNLIKERGWTAEWKYNRKATIQKVTIGIVITSAVLAFLLYKKKAQQLKRS